MASVRCKLALAVGTILVAGALIAVARAATRDGATIVNSGSTNALGFKIELYSDGSGSVVLQDRAGRAKSQTKAFKMPLVQAKQFFAHLKAARDGNAANEHCMKSASFGTTTHVEWHGWTSPDLDCPPADKLDAALVHDYEAIRSASGVDTMTLHRNPTEPGLPRIPIELPSSSSPDPGPT
jgi:hypothetical protein